MSGKRKYLVVAVILLLVAFGAGAALAGDDAADAPTTEVDVNDSSQSQSSPSSESDEVEDDDEPGDIDMTGDVEDDDRAEADETSHPGDAAEDEAEGPDQPITGPDLERASQAALDYLGGGRVTGTEIEDEESYYEIEVTRDDGSQVDVQLDESFQVVGTD